LIGNINFSGWLRWWGLGATGGVLVGVVNWAWTLSTNDYARAYLLVFLVLWGFIGLGAGAAAGLGWIAFRRLASERAGKLEALLNRWPTVFGVLRKIRVIGAVLGLVVFAAYIGSAPRFAGLLTNESRDPAAESAAPPNIVLISLDTTRPDHLGAYGYPIPTSPTFDELASRGALFSRAVSTSNWTTPSHASFLTGMAPSHLGLSFGPWREGGWTKLPESATTLAEILSGAGYHTAAFIGGPTMQALFGFAQGFDIYNERLPASFSRESDRVVGARRVRRLLNIPPSRFLRFFDPAFLALSNFLYEEGFRSATEVQVGFLDRDLRWASDADEVNHKIFKWLDRQPPRPFFLFAHYFDPHDPY
jgi:hypothetical protein